MTKVVYLRFVTYALFAAAFLWPAPKRHVIPVELSAPVQNDPAVLVDELYRKRQASEDVARVPGFETTKRSGREVLHLALDVAGKNGTDLSAYRPPQISLHRRRGKMEWLVSWEEKGMPVIGGFFSVGIDDETGETRLIPGM